VEELSSPPLAFRSSKASPKTKSSWGYTTLAYVGSFAVRCGSAGSEPVQWDPVTPYGLLSRNATAYARVV